MMIGKKARAAGGKKKQGELDKGFNRTIQDQIIGVVGPGNGGGNGNKRNGINN